MNLIHAFSHETELNNSVPLKPFLNLPVSNVPFTCINSERDFIVANI